MTFRDAKYISLLWVLVVLGASESQTREMSRNRTVLPDHTLGAEVLQWCGTMHNIGNLELLITNDGQFSNGMGPDCITGEPMKPGCIFPKGSNQLHLLAGTLMVGAVVGQDTLVSSGASELWPDVSPFGDIRTRSIIGTNGGEPDAVSEQDIICVFADTFTVGVSADYFHFRPHIPLGIEVTQSSYAWSYGYAEDFILFDLSIRSIGDEVLNDLYVGLHLVPYINLGNLEADDDLCGFLTHVESPFGCGFVDTIYVAWGADNDGDPIRGEWVEPAVLGEGSVRHVTGAILLRASGEAARPNFNWWITHYTDPTLDFGPRRKGTCVIFAPAG